MTLSVGNKLVKLDEDGNPTNPNKEAYVEFEVIETGNTQRQGEDIVQDVKLKIIK